TVLKQTKKSDYADK
ncbi:23S rRNA methyltransferase attenuation leader peptide, partial [Shigella sonnei]|nr:23S rRNA methyltransferase attenuation leader peptide [Klebsiella pneumoniae]HCB2931597.1 23S rRNA methyltransferase attenuation leader peptide [Klebsiella pneumoniae]HCY4339381.1 23S rRNA methyltransferase attenuation leader peptide [Shigella sonnei]